MYGLWHQCPSQYIARAPIHWQHPALAFIHLPYVTFTHIFKVFPGINICLRSRSQHSFIVNNLLIHLLLILYSACQSSLSIIFVLLLSFTLIHYDSLSMKRLITKIYSFTYDVGRISSQSYIHTYSFSILFYPLHVRKIILLLCCTHLSEETVYQCIESP